MAPSDFPNALKDATKVFASELYLKKMDAPSAPVNEEGFTDLCNKFEESLPALCKTKKVDDANYFLALACAESLGAVLYDTNDEDNGQGMLVVEAVRGVADVACVPVGSCLKYLNSETLPLGLTVDDLGAKVGTIKTNEAVFFVGFDTHFHKENATPGYTGKQRRASVMT